jgi:hypothetical protein
MPIRPSSPACFRNIDFNSDANLGRIKDRNRRLKHLLEHFHKPELDLRHVDGSGAEFWLARELMPVPEYETWRAFTAVIAKAQTTADQANQPASDHFAEVGKMVSLSSRSRRTVQALLRLHGGLGAGDIHQRKSLKKSQQILEPRGQHRAGRQRGPWLSQTTWAACR